MRKLICPHTRQFSFLKEYNNHYCVLLTEFKRENGHWAAEVGIVFAIKSEDLSVIPRSCMLVEGSQLLQAVF